MSQNGASSTGTAPPPEDTAATDSGASGGRADESDLPSRGRRLAPRRLPTSKPNLKGRLQRLIRAVEQRAEQTELRRDQWPRYVLRVAIQVVRQWVRDRCPQQAASLAFQTSLSLAPMLAVALAALRVSGNVGAESAFVDFVAREFIPVSREVIATQLTKWSDNVRLQSQGLVGLAITALLAFVTVNSIERSVNIIWRSERNRSLAQKFVVFYATATMGPLLIGTSLYQAARFGLTDGWSGLFFSFATSFGALFMVNYFLPAARVRARSAAMGALVGAILFETAKFAFNGYVASYAFARYSGIYGTLALVPLWLLWVYYSWLTFLLGVEVAYATQYLRLVQRSDRRRPMSLENEIIQRVNGVVAARIMMTVSAAYIGGDKVVSRRALQDIFDLSDEVLVRLVERLKQNDLVIEVGGDHNGFLPARPPSEISLAEVLDAFRADDALNLPVEGAEGTMLDKVLAEINQHTQEHTEDLYFDQLV